MAANLTGVEPETADDNGQPNGPQEAPGTETADGPGAGSQTGVQGHY